MLIAALQHVSRGRLFVTSYMRDHKIKILCKIIILVAGLVLVSAEKSETRRFETKIKTKTRGFETKNETKTKQTGLETRDQDQSRDLQHWISSIIKFVLELILHSS